MPLAQNVKGISKLAMILLLLISFLLGTILSYIWTMGFYASPEFHLPSQTNLTIENVRFPAEDATFFDVTMLNPSYSPSNATIERIKVSTSDDKTHNIALTSPTLPLTLAPGKIQTIRSFWNWANYTGQTVDVYAVIAQGSGPAFQVKTAFMNFSITSVNLDPSVSANYFNITIQNAGSPTFVNISKILVNGAEVLTEPALTEPYGLSNASGVTPVTFMLKRNWVDLQAQDVTVAVQTLQGYTAYKTVRGPPRVVLEILNAYFNASVSLNHFNLTVLNAGISPTDLDISEVTVFVAGNITRIQNWTAYVGDQVTSKLERYTVTIIKCPWDWSGYRNQDVTITVATVQGFQVAKTTYIQ